MRPGYLPSGRNSTARLRRRRGPPAPWPQRGDSEHGTVVEARRDHPQGTDAVPIRVALQAPGRPGSTGARPCRAARSRRASRSHSTRNAGPPAGSSSRNQPLTAGHRPPGAAARRAGRLPRGRSPRSRRGGPAVAARGAAPRAIAPADGANRERRAAQGQAGDQTAEDRPDGGISSRTPITSVMNPGVIRNAPPRITIAPSKPRGPGSSLAPTPR